MKRMDTINVIPFIDIMLVLLAIVLATATFIAEGKLEIALPEAREQSAMVERDPSEIAVDRDGGLYFDALPVSLDTLSARLNTLATDTPIRLRVDAGAEFGRFVTVVDLLKARGLQRVSIITQSP
ncbi:biopolymer transporter ExbD [Thiohalocapsa marina]|uniref:Biopolymer transporter ExbD n=1 Tax=Thiohalocapsa marina TaxID=424902 RepID=A0A5M8FSD0_9GAMM|nr:biopolymer transporter ExbD [Thiohalocapsa marina]KAA6184852.1 biopolymer transporter ExbD [Thiohalocapsa marina]